MPRQLGQLPLEKIFIKPVNHQYSGNTVGIILIFFIFSFVYTLAGCANNFLAVILLPKPIKLSGAQSIKEKHHAALPAGRLPGGNPAFLGKK
jgi:hypothetical protein